jgi:hypothetical protein
VRGPAADELVRSGRARWIAGGALAATACEVVARQDGATHRQVAGFDELEAWSHDASRRDASRLAGLLNRIEFRRAPAGD